MLLTFLLYLACPLAPATCAVSPDFAGFTGTIASIRRKHKRSTTGTIRTFDPIYDSSGWTMKRLAMMAVLAAVGGSLAPTLSWAQAVQGYSKFTMKDQTRPD